MDKIVPGTLCRIVNFPPANNAIVQAVHHLPDTGEWVCKAMQHLPGIYTCPQLGVQFEATVQPGEEIAIFTEYLKPLHDGDGLDEMVLIAGRPGLDARV